MNKVSFIVDFIDNQVTDSHLPLKVHRPKVDKFNAEVELCRRSQLVDSDFETLEPLKLSTSWSFNDMEDFESRQKTICIPLFELPCEEIQFYDFRNRPVLPFLSYESRKVGGYGTVRKARIHEAHYSHIQDCKTRNRTLREFAIKELHTESKEAYDQEMELFRKIGARSESESPRHLIQLQFSYLYGDRYFLVFPWADGNLREFWAKHHDYHLRKDKDIVWFFRQCKGLARALQKVHILTSLSDASKADFKVALGNLTHGKLKRWGRHGDIKPENILWFEKYDEMEDFLVISDFGLTSFNTTTSRSINLILEKGSPRDTIYGH
uniref:Protein kinase domain-containing protein n=1 Tax=Colletotrichum fructicola (strain Nara gc5) TaxID=1213859 RepID=L2FSY7_COLFN